MSLTPSTMIPLGIKAPDFSLTEVVSGKNIFLDSFRDKQALLVMFICHHCPYVRHVQHELSRIGADYQDKNLGIVAISSNDVSSHPDDSTENLKQMAKELKFTFPYGYDETQDVAKDFNAACTPDFFLFDQERRLAYRGQLDDSRPGNNLPVTGRDLRAAIDAVLQNKPVNSQQRPSSGCNIKWKGN